MKKIYLRPVIQVVNLKPAKMLCSSAVDIYSNRDFGYGGVDSEGFMNPD